MNADQLTGKWMQFQGELKRQWGRLRNDELCRITGDCDKLIGKLRERYGDEQEGAGRAHVMWVDQWYRKFKSTMEHAGSKQR